MKKNLLVVIEVFDFHLLWNNIDIIGIIKYSFVLEVGTWKCNCLEYAFLSNQFHSHKSLSQWVDCLIVSNNHIELIMVVVSLSLALRDFTIHS